MCQIRDAEVGAGVDARNTGRQMNATPCYCRVRGEWGGEERTTVLHIGHCDSGVFGQTENADAFTYYGTRAAVATATVCTAAATSVGTYEFAALGNQSIMVEGVLGGGRMGSGGNPLPHIDSPPLGWSHWPWQ